MVDPNKIKPTSWDDTKLTLDQQSQIKSASAQYTAATTKEGRDSAHALAEAVRKQAGYSGGDNGSQNILLNTPTPKAVDNSGLINSSTDSLISALKSQIAQQTNNKNLAINGLNDKYQPTRNDSEVRKYREMASLTEQAANAGDRGPTGRQNVLLADTEGANRINSIDLQQGNEKASLQNDISNLMLEGNVQEAQLKSQQLRDLIANNTNMDNTNYARGQDTLANDRISTENAKNDYISTIGQFYDNYQAEIDKLTNDNDTSNDWKISYLKAARVEKQAAQKTAAATAEAKKIADKNAITKANYDSAFDRWKAAGKVLTQADANVLGVPIGSQTEAYTQSQMSNSVSQQNANTNAGQLTLQQSKYNTEQTNIKNGLNADGSPKIIKPIPYKENPDFQSEVSDIESGNASLADVKANATALQKAYGYDGYQELIKKATPKKSTNVWEQFTN